MEEGGSKAESPPYPPTINDWCRGLAFSAECYQSVVRHTSKDNLCKCCMAFRYYHRLHASILKSCVFLHAPF